MNKEIYKAFMASALHTGIASVALLFFFLGLCNSWAGPTVKTNADQPDMIKGNIDFLHEDGTIVINDTIFFIDKNTRYFTLTGHRISQNNLNKGDIVSFKASKEQLLKELYVTKKAEIKETPPIPASKQSPRDMYQENGVWKNR